MSVHPLAFPAAAAAPASGFSSAPSVSLCAPPRNSAGASGSLCAPSRNSAGASGETYTIWQVARLIGCKHFGKDRLLSYMRALIAGHGFPRPLPAPVKKRAVADVHPESQWRRVAVDHWLDGFLPPDCSAALDDRALAAAANDMDARAANLRAIG